MCIRDSIKEILDDPHVKEREMFVEMDHPTLGKEMCIRDRPKAGAAGVHGSAPPAHTECP